MLLTSPLPRKINKSISSGISSGKNKNKTNVKEKHSYGKGKHVNLGWELREEHLDGDLKG